MLKRLLLTCALVCALGAPARAVDIVLDAANAMPATNGCVKYSGNILSSGPWAFLQCSYLAGSRQIFWKVPIPPSFTGTFSSVRITYLPAGFDPTKKVCFNFRLTVFNYQQGVDGQGSIMLTAPQTSQVGNVASNQAGVNAPYQTVLATIGSYTPSVRTGVTNAETLCTVGGGSACAGRMGLAMLERNNTGGCTNNLPADVLIDNVRLRF